MKRELTLQKKELYYFVDGEKKFGAPDGLTGCVDDIYGCVDGLTGCVTGIYGCVDDCDISAEDREKGINISSLVMEA